MDILTKTSFLLLKKSLEAGFQKKLDHYYIKTRRKLNEGFTAFYLDDMLNVRSNER